MMGHLRIKQVITSKTKDMLKRLSVSDYFDNPKNNYPNSAYRYAKQQGFINALDIFGAIESNKKGIDKL